MKGKKAKVCNRVFVLFCLSTRIYSARSRCLESGLTYLRRHRFAPPFISESIEYFIDCSSCQSLNIKILLRRLFDKESAFNATFGALVMANLSSASLENRFHRCQMI